MVKRKKKILKFSYMFRPWRPSSDAFLMLTYTGCSEKEVQGRILEHTIQEITAKWKTLHNEDFTIHTPHKHR